MLFGIPLQESGYHSNSLGGFAPAPYPTGTAKNAVRMDYAVGASGQLRTATSSPTLASNSNRIARNPKEWTGEKVYFFPVA